MTKDIELVHGSGNVFRDFGRPNADLEQLRSILAARIIRVLDERELSVRKAKEITGIAAAHFSRIRRANLERFTVDRLMTILARLDQQVQVRVSVRPRAHHRAHARVCEEGRGTWRCQTTLCRAISWGSRARPTMAFMSPALPRAASAIAWTPRATRVGRPPPASDTCTRARISTSTSAG